MNKKTIIRIFLGSIAIAGIAYFALFTPAGVHVIGEDLFPSDEAELYVATDYPTVVSQNLTAETLPLVATVMQPSGIDYDEANDTFIVVTDQAEIIELSNDFSTLLASEVMSNKPLLFRQGTVESTDYYNGQLFVSGDAGQIEIWKRNDQTWEKSGEVNQPAATSVGAEGMAIDPITGHIYMGDGDAVHVLDQTGQYVRTLAFAVDVKNDRSFSEYEFSGLDFYDGVLYVVSEYFGVILAIDPETGSVIDSYGLSGLEQGAGLAVTRDAFYIVVDHENNEPSPGIKKYKRQSLVPAEEPMLSNDESADDTAVVTEVMAGKAVADDSAGTPASVSEKMSQIDSVTPAEQITEDEARRIALTQISGEIEEVELEEENGQLIYEVEYAAGHEVEIDGRTGAVLLVEKED